MRIIIILCTLILCFTQLHSQSAPCGQVFNDNFDSDGALPVEWTEYNTSGQVSISGSRLQFDYTDAIPSAYRNFIAVDENYTYTFEVESTRNWVKAKMHLVSSSGKYLTSLVFGNNEQKNIQYATGLDLFGNPDNYSDNLITGNYDKNVSYKVTLMVDFTDRTIDFYLNDVLKADKIPFIGNAEDFAKIDIKQLEMYSGEGCFFFDNLLVSKGTVNRIDLSSKISTAQSILEEASIGTDYGQYSQANADALEDEINAATSVYEDCSATQVEVDLANNNLTSAIKAFQDAMISDPVLIIYSEYNFSGSMLELECGHYNGTLGDFNDETVSFTLDKGYMVTFAQNINGTGMSKVYIASEENLQINLPEYLQKSVSFIRVGPWRDAKRKGIGAKGADVIEALNCDWYCNWSNNGESSGELEFVPNQWGGGTLNGALGLGQRMDITHHMAFNEPDNDDQSNMTVDKAIEKYELLLASGLRLGSPANTDGAKGASWRNEFMTKAEAAGYRVDYMVVHYYKKSTPVGLYNWLKAIYNKWKRPIWIKEFNYGAPWVNNAPVTNQAASDGLNGYINMLDTCSFVERYAVFTWQPDNPVYSLMSVRTPVALSTSGIMYKNHVSPVAYIQEDYEQGPQVGTAIERNNKEQLTIYPNPVVNGTIYINYADKELNEQCTLSIYDLQGNEVMTYINAPQKVNIEKLSKGIYFFKIGSGNSVSVKKIIIK
ncbi:MAG: glycosyl hydrolase [Bacteroidales bacterium]|nr:glycosyl hydrolase [Bacteroidales bacterium]